MSLTKSQCIPGIPVMHERGFTGILTGKFTLSRFTENELVDVIRSDGIIYHADLRFLYKHKK